MTTPYRTNRPAAPTRALRDARTTSAQRGPRSAIGGIEWEEVPSLAHRLRETLNRLEARATPTQPATRGMAWDETMPAELSPLGGDTAPAPFLEAIDGLQTREVNGENVFAHFFGRH